LYDVLSEGGSVFGFGMAAVGFWLAARAAKTPVIDVATGNATAAPTEIPEPVVGHIS
jgi:hypothetical protein